MRWLPSGRSLHWERGLKRSAGRAEAGIAKSLPSLGAWIETSRPREMRDHVEVAPFTGSVD